MRDNIIPAMHPIKVKKELEDYASLIHVFGQNSSFVREQGHRANWKRILPCEILEELDTLSGWERCEDQKRFLVHMPAEQDSLDLYDSDPVPWLCNPLGAAQ